MPFRRTEWDARPPEVRAIKGGRYLVARNVEAVERDGATVYVGESAVMSEAAYAAYAAASAITVKREQEIADETILALIEEGSL